jgi:hypothetical protein
VGGEWGLAGRVVLLVVAAGFVGLVVGLLIAG